MADWEVVVLPTEWEKVETIGERFMVIGDTIVLDPKANDVVEWISLNVMGILNFDKSKALPKAQDENVVDVEFTMVK